MKNKKIEEKHNNKNELNEKEKIKQEEKLIDEASNDNETLLLGNRIKELEEEKNQKIEKKNNIFSNKEKFEVYNKRQAQEHKPVKKRLK